MCKNDFLIAGDDVQFVQGRFFTNLFIDCI